ncbi:hypothetical protein TNCV_3517231 [Trichonephila clavipes]|nr:hypothetical protein TNCV_3517231 [Trichonephila clavipes]
MTNNIIEDNLASVGAPYDDPSRTPIGRAESRVRRWPSSRRDQDLPTAKSVRVEILFCRNLSLRSRLAFRRGIGKQGGCSVKASLANLSAYSYP